MGNHDEMEMVQKTPSNTDIFRPQNYSWWAPQCLYIITEESWGWNVRIIFVITSFLGGRHTLRLPCQSCIEIEKL
jgi:hypothetical protein